MKIEITVEPENESPKSISPNTLLVHVGMTPNGNGNKTRRGTIVLTGNNPDKATMIYSVGTAYNPGDIVSIQSPSVWEIFKGSLTLKQ